jgi:CHAD domain-containing protein
VLGYVDAQLAQLRRLEPAVRDAEPDSVHRMRVAARRTRAVLQEFRPLFGDGAALEPVLAELRWLGRELAAARDVEVLRDLLIAQLDEVPVESVLGPVRARVTGHYAPRLAEAERGVREILDSARYRRLLAELADLVASPPLAVKAARDARDVLPKMVAHSQRRVRRRMLTARQAAGPGGERDRALHEARKAAKRARYAAEAVAPVIGRRPRKSAKALEKLQSTLGEHHDSVIAADELRLLAIRVHAEGENAYTYGLLNARQVERAERLADRARRQWRRADRRKRTAWMAA